MAKTLSAFRFFGGKSRTAGLICDMLDYAHTHTYIEPFGGGARCMLNKPRHSLEIYNDASAGLCAFMRVMSDPDRADELINKLYETEFSPEQFYEAVLFRNGVEDNYFDEYKRQANQYIKHLISKYGVYDFEALKNAISRLKIADIQAKYQTIIKSNILNDSEINILQGFIRQLENCVNEYNKIYPLEYQECYQQHYDDFHKAVMENIDNNTSLSPEEKEKLKHSYQSDKEYKKQLKQIERVSKQEAHSIAYNAMDNIRDTSYTRVNDKGNTVIVDIDDIDLAAATYIVYSQSRDGMGKVWSAQQYKSTDDYHRELERLYDVAERLQGVQVQQVGALGFLLDCKNPNSENETPYLNNPSVCFYLDPSYLDPSAEERNLGSTYKFSSDYDAHELLLKTICEAKARILISNYDVDLYNQYLTPERGWKKMEFETSTSVGGLKDNKRVEILWWNY